MPVEFAEGVWGLIAMQCNAMPLRALAAAPRMVTYREGG